MEKFLPSPTVKLKTTEDQRVDVSQASSTRQRALVVEPESYAQQSRHAHEKRLITFSWMKSVHSEEQDIANRLNNENDVAESMCLPLMMNGVDIGVALVDQGASRSVMRRSAFDRVKRSMRTIPYFYTVRNMFVVGSTNEHILVIGCFKADLYTHDKKFVSETLICR